MVDEEGMTPRPDLSVEPTAREVRMLTTLLAGCDPCGYVDQGGSPNLYAGMALATLRRLHRGTDAVDLLNVFPDDASAPAALQFARVAVHWWSIASGVNAPRWPMRRWPSSPSHLRPAA